MAAKDVEIKIEAPYPAQQKILDNRKRNNLLILSRRWGKTTLSKRLVNRQSIITPNYRAAWSSPTWKLMQQTFEEFRETLAPISTRISREDRRIELINGSVIELWSSDDISAGRGRKYNIWVHDEAQRQKNLSRFIKASVRPSLADLRGELWVLGTANGEGSEMHDFYLDCIADPSWHVAKGIIEDNPYIDPEEIAQMRRDLPPEIAAQELDSEWIRVSGQSPLTRRLQWDALYGEVENNTTLRVLALDCSINGDNTVLVGVWRDPNTELFHVDYGDVLVFEADEDTDNEINYRAVEEAIWAKWITGRYSALTYDPYQAVSLIQRLKRRGVRCKDFQQGKARLQSDSFLRQCINEAKLRHPDHHLLTDHVLSCALKYTGDNFRIVKSNKGAKIDLAVALSMALFVCQSQSPGAIQPYNPQVAGQRAPTVPLLLPTAPQAGSSAPSPLPGPAFPSHSPFDFLNALKRR